ncbi:MULTISPECIES: ABC transporter substrate-binding protein [unclassified Rhizobium]|uniref:ABC transporter substrate-binding protein n=1 Tax=unclassified Rhizobium TaxID=2613769 RepID=UPI000CDF3968|nr:MULTISPECIES: ABC transporter substrate-binding protein [Rhizobium]AVA23487.1 sugar ABC transporter substrate-binding protein [Rhizobium sp. NXC24]MDK4739519.1 ABC transporter substrate-binding protein [Rhizobium sp. CNPSo 3464]UWU20831.1 ABC transporter substrate-binding protein [Rhizobium tropici]
MTLTIDRRQLLAGMAATLAFSGIGLNRANAATSMRLLWWGSKERSDRTFAAVKAYQAKNPDVTIAGESFGWDSYWTRLATQTGGGNAPDLIQMDYRYIFEYARRGALLDMTPYLGKSLAIEDFGAPNINSGKVDGKIYGVNLGVNSSMVVVNVAAWQEAGVEPPHDGMTWEQLGEACAKVTAAKKRRGFYGTADQSGGEPDFECWLRQRGKALYTSDGKLGFEAKDAAEWFSFWDHLREIGACVPADVQALYKQTLETDMLVTKKAAVSYAFSNQFVAIQGLVKEKIDLIAYPSDPGSKPGQYLKPSMLMSVSATSANKDAAVAFVNYLVEDPEGAKILGVERGVPASPKIRDLLTPDLDATSKQVVDYIGRLTPKVGALPPSPPNGAGENAFLLKKIAEEVAFGKTSAQDAGAKFTEQAAANITRG